MSGIEVVAAVAAVVSAFHGGSELVKIIKEKRRKSRQSQQEFEEKQLQESLLVGEQQIGSRYAQDIKEMGDVMVVGDTLARDLLLHIAVNMQAEIIKGLQMAVQNPTVVLNLRLLHEATITNRKDTCVTLDELKQRLIMTRPFLRQLQDVPQHRAQLMTVPSTRSNTFDLSNAVPEDHVPSAVLSGSHQGLKQPKSSLARYLQTKRSTSTSGKASGSAPIERPSINYCQAFEEMVKSRGEDRSTLLNDIDEITMLYKGLDAGSMAPQQLWNQNQHTPNFMQRRGTLDVLRGEASTQRSSQPPELDSFQAPDSQLPSHSWSSPLFKQNVFNGQPQHPMYSTPTQYPNYQDRPSHRYSDSSTASTSYSDMSRDRHDSDSSRTSYGSTDPRYSLYSSSPMSKPAIRASVPSNVTSQRHNDTCNTYQSYAQTEQPHTKPIAPLTVSNKQPLRTSLPADGSFDTYKVTDEPALDSYSQHIDTQRTERVPSAIAPFASPPDSPTPVKENAANASPTQQSMLSPEVRSPPSSHSSSSGHTVTVGSLSAPWLRTMSAPVVGRIRQPSIASTDSSGSGSFGILPRPVSTIPSSTIRSPKPGQERMMNGRPCKDNNYWGFCKGSWDVREDTKKGLALRTMPSGMYNTKEIWECKSCNFRGNTFSIAHPTKKNKKETIVDPNIHVSKCGIRYRWIFLAKSHVKKKTPDSTNEECNYGCVVCSVESKVTSVFGNVDTLMYHLLEHASDMTQMTMKQTKCVVGRTAGENEDWDINMPLFADVSEVEG